MKLDLPPALSNASSIPVFTAANLWNVVLLDERGRERARATRRRRK